MEVASFPIEGLIHKYELSADKAATLVLMIHGRCGNVDVMSTFRRNLPPDWSQVYVQAPLNEDQGFSWWLADADVRESAKLQAERLIRFLQRFISSHQLKPSKLVAIGFSQGAALASVLAQSVESQVVDVALLSGFWIGIGQENLVAEKAAKKRVFISHGTEDKIIEVEHARKTANKLTDLGWPVVYVEEPVAHKIGILGQSKLKQWLAEG